jgi:hypothetical protein
MPPSRDNDNDRDHGHDRDRDADDLTALRTPWQVRQAARRGRLTGHTSGLAPGHVQGNLVILPQALAGDFLRYCQRNPKPCPLLAVGEPGDAALPTLGQGIDLRSDLPRYRVWRDGRLVDEPHRDRSALARRPGELRARLLVLVRAGPAGRRPAGAPPGDVAQRGHVPQRACPPCRPGPLPARWW